MSAAIHSTKHRIRRISTVAGIAAVALAAVAGCESPDDGPPGTVRFPAASPQKSAAERPAPTVDWSEPETLASGPAEMGPWKMNESKFHYLDDPTVRWLPGGDLAVAYVDNQRQNVYFRTFAPDGTPRLDSPVDVSRSPDTFSWLPKVAVSEEGSEIYILWQEIVFSGGSHGGEAFFARSTDGGESFEEPINLSETKDGDGKGRLSREIWHNGSLDVAVGADGDVLAAWTAYEGDLWFSRSTDGGESFSDPVDIAGTTATPARAPDFGVGPDGVVHLAWTVGESDTADIRVATAKEGSSFSEPSIPFETDGHSDGPKIAVARDGTVHLAFGESPEGRFERYAVRYARRSEGEDFEGTPTVVAAPDDGIDSVNFPDLRVDGKGRAHLVWERYPDHDGQPLGIGYAQVDGDGGVTAPVRVPGASDSSLGFNGSLQGMLMQKLDVDESGRIAVVNSRFDEGNASRIRLHLGEQQ